MERPSPEQIRALVERFAQDGPHPELLEAIDAAFRALFPDGRLDGGARVPMTQGRLPLDEVAPVEPPESLREQGPLPMDEEPPPDPDEASRREGDGPEPAREASCRDLHRNLVRALTLCRREPYVRDPWAVRADLAYDPVADCTARLQLLLDPDGRDCRVQVHSDLPVPPGREGEALGLCLRWNRQVGYPRARSYRPGPHGPRRLELVFGIPREVLADAGRLVAFLRPHLHQSKAFWRLVATLRLDGPD